MSVVIKDVLKGSPAYKKGMKPGELLLELNGKEIMDVLDYRFYQNDRVITVTFKDQGGKVRQKRIKKQEDEELGLEFETYLMDKQHSCRNNCVFCFIDQLPKGMRESLYFKDDDSRMSFLFGNYITLTNITEREVERILEMHISPINVSVHTTDPELRCRMMNNRFAGKALEILRRFCEAGIDVNCQLVLCPGWNDGENLRKSLEDLTNYESVKSIACVPVGLTGHREGLEKLEPFSKKGAAEVIDVTDEFGDRTARKYGERRVFAADEFYIIAEQPMPDAAHYGEFLQLENGVGMWALMKRECDEALENTDGPKTYRKISGVTGEAAFPLISNIVDKACGKWHNLQCKVYPIRNKFFGGEITVTGLVTGTDIIDALRGEILGEELLVPAAMLRREGDMFLDDVTVEELEKALNVKVRVVENDGWELIAALAGEKGEI